MEPLTLATVTFLIFKWFLVTITGEIYFISYNIDIADLLTMSYLSGHSKITYQTCRLGVGVWSGCMSKRDAVVHRGQGSGVFPEPLHNDLFVKY